MFEGDKSCLGFGFKIVAGFFFLLNAIYLVGLLCTTDWRLLTFRISSSPFLTWLTILILFFVICSLFANNNQNQDEHQENDECENDEANTPHIN